MIRSAYILGFVLLAIMVAAVFQIENKVDGLRAQFKETNKQMMADKEEIHVLKSEWAYLSKPERLKKLSDKYLPGYYASSQQVGRIENISFSPSYLALQNGIGSKQAMR